MRTIVTALCTAILAAAFLSAAEPRTAAELRASYQKHQAEFDYLLGDWEFTTVSREYGKGRGYWSSVRLAEGQILDEFRIVGDKGETWYVTTTLRAFNATLDRWELVSMDEDTGLQNIGTGQMVGAEMHIEQKFGVLRLKPTTLRIRYYNIRPDSFSWTADASTDGGKTWVTNSQQIEARRIGPPRHLGALAPARNAPH
jgi:hypothetical protein